MQIWEPLKLLVEWGENDWQTIVIITTTLIYTKHNNIITPKIKYKDLQWCVIDPETGKIKPTGNVKAISFLIETNLKWFSANASLKIKKERDDEYNKQGDLIVKSIKWYTYGVHYNWGSDGMGEITRSSKEFWGSGDAVNFWNSSEPQIELLNVHLAPEWETTLQVKMHLNSTGSDKFVGKLWVEIADEIDDYTNVIPKIWASDISQQGDYTIIKSDRGIRIYSFAPEYNETMSDLKGVYFIESFHLEAGLGVHSADVVMTDTQIYRFANKNNMGIISIYPQVAWSDGEHTSYPGVYFLWAVRMNNLIYIIAENVGITGLYVYNGAELLPVVAGEIKNNSTDLIGGKRRFLFNRITHYDNKIILATSNGEVYAYGRNAGGNALTNILKLEWGEKITKLEVKGGKLCVWHKEGSAIKILSYADKQINQCYRPERQISFPIQVGSHLTEKEAQDLEVSYRLPNKNCKLEVWGKWGEYEYWTFKCESGVSFTAGEQYTVRAYAGEYSLEYKESHGDWHTFKLKWDLPYQTGLIQELWGANQQRIRFSEMHHFAKIGEISAEGYKEGVERFTNINYALDLGPTHTLQVMIKGKGDENQTPELFSVLLNASQKQR